MKKLIITLALLTSQLFAQTDEQQLDKLQDYLIEQIGKKVGSGLCFDLVDKAIMKVNRNWKKASKGKYRYVYGTRIDGTDVRIGDVISGHNHVVIVLGFDETSGEALIAHQNTGVSSLKDSRVVVWTLKEYVESHNVEKLKYYRPILHKK